MNFREGLGTCRNVSTAKSAADSRDQQAADTGEDDEHDKELNERQAGLMSAATDVFNIQFHVYFVCCLYVWPPDAQVSGLD